MTEIFHTLKSLLKKAGHVTSVGDEGMQSHCWRQAGVVCAHVISRGGGVSSVRVRDSPPPPPPCPLSRPKFQPPQSEGAGRGLVPLGDQETGEQTFAAPTPPQQKWGRSEAFCLSLVACAPRAELARTRIFPGVCGVGRGGGRVALQCPCSPAPLLMGLSGADSVHPSRRGRRLGGGGVEWWMSLPVRYWFVVLTCLGEEDHLLGYHAGPRSQHTRRLASAPFPRGVGLRSPCVSLQCGCEGMRGGGVPCCCAPLMGNIGELEPSGSVLQFPTSVLVVENTVQTSHSRTD